MKQIILGTAGHIDHGKTSLIKAITGTDTDRLKEEKLRGITIELGFASLNLPSGKHLGIVDVPGHEKFVKNMVAGATGIDIVAMVIAADEGVMPQTREHMEICSLLDIKYGIIVLTKIDMVDEEWLELVQEDIFDFTQGTFLEDAPLAEVSSSTGQGIPDLIKSLDDLCEKIPRHPSTGFFRLPIDRVFTIKGFGTVITGSLISGSISVGEPIMIYPSGIVSKVRGIQVHGKSLDCAESGMRTAINFQGLEKSAVNRGDTLAPADCLKPSYMADLNFNYLASNPKPIKNRTRVRFHTGTSEIMGNMILLDRDELLPGEGCPAQIRLDSPVSLVRDDRFVIRSYSPVRTIAGGNVLNPIPAKHKRFNNDVLDGLKALVDSDQDKIMDFHLTQAGYKGVSLGDLKLMTNLSENEITGRISKLLSSRQIVQTDKEKQKYIHGSIFSGLVEKTRGCLEKFHMDNPLKEGMPKEELKSKLPSAVQSKLFNQIIMRMVKSKDAVQSEDSIRLAGHKVALKVDMAEASENILSIYRESGLTPPYFKDLSKNFNIDQKSAKDVLVLLVKKGEIIKVKEDLYFHKDPIEKLKKMLVDFLKANDEISTPELKKIAGISRKYLIPLIEYFDSKNITIRVGDSRRLRNG